MTANEQATPRFNFPPGSIEIGRHEIVPLPDDVIELRQVRQDFDPEGIERLARSMIRDALGDEKKPTTPEDFEKIIILLHPMIVNCLTASNLSAFVRDHADYYSLDITEVGVPEIRNDEVVNIKVAGARRQLALQWIADTFGFNVDAFSTPTVIKQNLSFDELHALQYRENSHEKVSNIEEAQDIYRYYSYKKRHNEYPTHASVASYFGVSRSKVSSALSFASLPQAIQDFSEGSTDILHPTLSNPILPYSVVARLSTVSSAFSRLHNARSSNPEIDVDPLEEYIGHELYLFALRLAHLRLSGMSADKLHTTINQKTSEINERALPQTGELFFIAEQGPAQRTRDSTSKLAKQVFGILGLLSRHGKLQKEHIDLLAGLVAQAKEKAASNKDDSQLSF